MGNNSINDAFKELESMSNQIKNKKQAQSQNANYDQYNELDSFSRCSKHRNNKKYKAKKSESRLCFHERIRGK